MSGHRREPRGQAGHRKPAQVCKAAFGISSPPFSGVGLGFLFSWLLILMVFTTFLVGGNVQTLVCRNWVNQEIYKVGGQLSVVSYICACIHQDTHKCPASSP